MPPRRPAGGRHRRPKNTGAPAYLTAATLAAFTISGVNVPGAIGSSRDTETTPVASNQDQGDSSALMALELRDRLHAQQAARASRLRSLKQDALREARLAREAARRKARAAAERARPKWVAPVLNYQLSAGFGEASGLWSSTHTGQDFSAAYGSPVRSVGDGTIVFAGWDGSYGEKIAVQHDDGTVTWYAHLSSFERTGGRVQAGQIIGRVGTTGNSTGSHLHFEVRPGDGSPIPPLTWLRAHGVQV